MKMLIKQAARLYRASFPDGVVVDSIVDIISEIKANNWTNDTNMGMYTVGDITVIRGFHCSEFIIKDMTDSFQGRSVRFCCLSIGIDVTNPNNFMGVFSLLASTDVQRNRIYPKIKQKLIQKFGDVVVDEKAVEELQQKILAMQQSILLTPTKQ